MFTEIAHLPKLLSISSSIVEIFLSIRICGFQMPITSKFDFSQVGDPKGVHQGYHEMTYTKFGRDVSHFSDISLFRHNFCRKSETLLVTLFRHLIFPTVFQKQLNEL